MSLSRDYYLHHLGVTQHRSRDNQTLVEDPWTALQNQVKSCRACALCEGRTQTVFGVGDQHADLVIVGEAPGYHEDQLGEPFVGRAGKLLDQMLKAVGLNRHQIYIANVLKCRPPNNRDPQMQEVLTCTPFLVSQLELIQPKLILAVGRHAAHFLLNTTESLARLRHQQHSYHDIPLIVSYHPAYLLRNPRDKSKAMQDWWLVAKSLKLFSN